MSDLNAMLSDRSKAIKPSQTFFISARAVELKKQIKQQGLKDEVFNLSVGQPGKEFDTPLHIKAAAIDAIHNGQTKYTAIAGIKPLRKAICAKLKAQNHLTYDPKEILVSTGAKQSLSNAILALINPGDEVIIPTPCWMSYIEMVNLAEGKAVFVSCPMENDFLIQADQIAQAITPRTKLLMLNSPSNPTGMLHTAAQLRAIGDVLRQHPHVVVISDEIYENLNWHDEGFQGLLMACPELKERCIIVNGVSKSYAMTGWRIGYAAGPSDIIKAMTSIQSQTTSCANSIAQVAATEALEQYEKGSEDMKVYYEKNADIMFDTLTQIPDLEMIKPQGALYAFPNIAKVCQRLGYADDIACCHDLLEKHKVAIIPGTYFEAPGHARISFACETNKLIEALERIKTFMMPDA